jgi:hypothetical protein
LGLVLGFGDMMKKLANVQRVQEGCKGREKLIDVRCHGRGEELEQKVGEYLYTFSKMVS